MLDDGSALLDSIGPIFKVIHLSLHQKTAKAVRCKRTIIGEKLSRLEHNADIANNTQCKELLDVVRSIIDINGAYCCHCNKSLGTKEMEQCNGYVII